MAANVLRLGSLVNNCVSLSKLYASKSVSSIIWKTNQFRYLHCTSLLAGDAIKLVMPALSPTMSEGTIVKWYKQEGDAVVAGDVLCDIQTDKAVVSFDWEDDGILAKILKPENSKDVKVGQIIGLMVEEGDDWKSVEIPEEEVLPPNVDAPPSIHKISTISREDEVSSVRRHLPSEDSKHAHGIGPAVRVLLDLYRVAPENIKASGPHNWITKGDVLQYIKENNVQQVQNDPAETHQPTAPKTLAPSPPLAVPPVAPSPDSIYTDHELSSMRRTIAKRLTQSKTTIPHSYAVINCKMNAATELRKSLLHDGIKVSVNDLIIKAVAVALQKHPAVNATWSGESVQLLGEIDVAVAVATENGLITPIVKDAAHLGVQEISNNVKDLASRAREGKLQLHEFQGGSFTISNLGMFGIDEFSAVINPPQACILAISGSKNVLNTNLSKDTYMSVTLSSDARVVDDLLAARFLSTFRDIMEDPMLMLVQSLPTQLNFRL